MILNDQKSIFNILLKIQNNRFNVNNIFNVDIKHNQYYLIEYINLYLKLKYFLY